MVRANKNQFIPIDLSDDWPLLLRLAEEREQQKRGFGTSKLLRGNASTHLIGLAGECALAKITGKPFDAKLRINGDGGKDFGEVDVKTSTYWPPILKHPVNPKFWPKWFSLVYFDEAAKQAFFIGTVSKEELQSGPRRTFNKSAGEQHSLDCEVVAEYSRAHLECRCRRQQQASLQGRRSTNAPDHSRPAQQMSPSS